MLFLIIHWNGIGFENVYLISNKLRGNICIDIMWSEILSFYWIWIPRLDLPLQLFETMYSLWRLWCCRTNMHLGNYSWRCSFLLNLDGNSLKLFHTILVSLQKFQKRKFDRTSIPSKLKDHNLFRCQTFGWNSLWAHEHVTEKMM